MGEPDFGSSGIMKILVIISKLYGGGAERVASLLVNHLCNHHDIIVALFDDRKTYPIDPKVTITNLSSDGKKLPYHLDMIRKCRKAINDIKPDMVISFMVKLNMYVVIANFFSRKKLILSEQTTIQTKQSLSKIITRHILYRLASKVVFVSKSDYNYAKWLNNKTFIYNPLSCQSYSNNKERENTIVTIGPQRRWQVKGFDLLIMAWAEIAKSHTDWKLLFVGAIDDNKISEMVKSYNIRNQVDFQGWTDDIAKVLQTKSIYVLSSRREGFPCSLLEAMSQVCACIAFDCKTGPNEIITNGKNGLIARDGDVEDLKEKMQLLIENTNLRQLLSASAVEDVKRFNIDEIMRQWDKLIQLTIEK